MSEVNVTEQTQRQTGSTCPYCGVGCGVIAQPVQHSGYQIQGDIRHPANAGKLCSKGSQLAATLEDNGRLLAPEIAGQQVDWSDALHHVADKIRTSIEQHGKDSVACYLSGQILTEDYYVMNKLMKGFIGSANVDTNSRLCMSSAVAAYKRAFGSDTVPTCYEDIEQTELMVLVGSNAAWTHPVLFQKMKAAQDNRPGYKMVVIDPKTTATAASADLHLAIKPGTDAMLFNGLLSYLARNNALDHAFIDEHTDGFEDALAACPDSLTEVALYCAVSENRLRQFYDWFRMAGKTVTFYSMGINQSNSGTDKCNAIINVHLASGKIGTPGSGPFSITGQPNAMGGREVGGLANMLAAHMDFNPGHRALVSKFWRSDNLAQAPGLKALDMFDAVERGDIKVLWIMGTNPAVSLPDSDRIKRILQSCDCVIVSDCMAQTDTTALADVLLPATTWGEKNGTVTNSERRITRQRPFRKAPGLARHDWWTICEVAKRLGFHESFSYQHPAEIFDEHAQLSGYHNQGSRDFDISGLAHLTQQQYDQLQPIQWPVNDRFPMGKSRLFGDGQFYTANGRANFITITPQLPELQADNRTSLLLNNGRSRDQWHTMTRTSQAPKLNGHRMYPALEMHSADLSRQQITPGQLVSIVNATGRSLAIAVRNDQQRVGECFAAIHWNEQFANHAGVNALVPWIADPVSGQPQFKQSRVRVTEVGVRVWTIQLTRERPEPTEALFSVQLPVRRGFLSLSAGRHEGDARRLTTGTDSDRILTYTSKGNGIERWVRVVDDQIDVLLQNSRVSPISDLVELVSLFEQGHCDAQVEQVLMNRQTAKLGQRVCSCFGVTEQDIRSYLQTHAGAGYRQVEQDLRCGSNCGSCQPEIKQIIQCPDRRAVSAGDVGSN